MHVKAKKTAFGGLCLAFTISSMLLGGVIETNTLFFLATASYLEGIMIRETGLRTGAAFYIAAVVLGFFMVPDKFYVLTYGAMAFYILLIEYAWTKMGKLPARFQNHVIFWIIKYLVFNLMYLPLLLAGRELLIGPELSVPLMAGIFLAGQIGLFLYDRAYEYVQVQLWSRWRKHIFMDNRN